VDDDVIGIIERAVNDQVARVTFGGDPGQYVQAIAWNASRAAARELARQGLVNNLGPGHHAMVTVDEARNHGRASITRRMVPIWSPVGLLRAGDPVEVIREEFDLTEAEAAVVAALGEDLADLARVGAEQDDGDDDSPPPELDTCRPVQVTVDGQEEIVRVHGAEPMDEQDRAALAELVAATRRHVQSTKPHLGVQQELIMACLAAMRCIPDGEVRRGCTVTDGAKVKARLKAAVTAAREALTPTEEGGTSC
jgi:uncharacterized protein (DUF433 family)